MGDPDINTPLNPASLIGRRYTTPNHVILRSACEVAQERKRSRNAVMYIERFVEQRKTGGFGWRAQIQREVEAENQDVKDHPTS